MVWHILHQSFTWQSFRGMMFFFVFFVLFLRYYSMMDSLLYSTKVIGFLWIMVVLDWFLAHIEVGDPTSTNKFQLDHSRAEFKRFFRGRIKRRTFLMGVFIYYTISFISYYFPGIISNFFGAFGILLFFRFQFTNLDVTMRPLYIKEEKKTL